MRSRPVNNFLQMWKELFVLGQRKVNVLRRRSNDQVLIGMTMVRAEVVVLGKVNLSKLLLNLEQGKSSILSCMDPFIFLPPMPKERRKTFGLNWNPTQVLLFNS